MPRRMPMPAGARWRRMPSGYTLRVMVEPAAARCGGFWTIAIRWWHPRRAGRPASSATGATPSRTCTPRRITRCGGPRAAARGASLNRSAVALLVRTLEVRMQQSRERLFRLLGLRYSPNEIYNVYLALESGKADRVTPAHDYLDGLLERENKRLVMPLLDSSQRLSTHARDLFRIEPKSLETAIRELLLSGDSWIRLLP